MVTIIFRLLVHVHKILLPSQRVNKVVFFDDYKKCLIEFKPLFCMILITNLLVEKIPDKILSVK